MTGNRCLLGEWDGRPVSARQVGTVITSYSIHYTKLYDGITVLYTLTGIGTALANIPIMGLLSSWFASRLRGKAAGFVVSGNGAAIVFAGLSVPWLNGLSPWSWRLSWVVLGVITSYSIHYTKLYEIS